MSWKRDLNPGDLDTTMHLEVTCRKCGRVGYETGESLQARDETAKLTLGEIERVLRCKDRTCRGTVRIALLYKGRMEGFTGGMA